MLGDFNFFGLNGAVLLLSWFVALQICCGCYRVVVMVKRLRAGLEGVCCL